MQFDLGLQGMAILLGEALIFGVLAHLVLRAATRWMWLIGTVAFVVGGLFFSEVLFATATVDEIQPIIDGLAHDEALLGGLLVGVPAAVIARLLVGGRSGAETPSAAS
jgi:hypothetical protein